MEYVFSHLFHSIIITVIFYIIMKLFLKQSETMSINRSILIGALSLIYMILFGHGLPIHINKI
jgi:putative effector of murein hydrolase